jgi:hypothetical protein
MRAERAVERRTSVFTDNVGEDDGANDNDQRWKHNVLPVGGVPD